MKFGIITFPGSNCDHDMVHVLRDVVNCEVHEIWHRDTKLPGLSTEDCIVLPGGFSYGDYVRAGAIAHLAPIMTAVSAHAAKGGLVLGICNGFQILCEAQLLPGALVRNAKQKFIGKDIFLRIETVDSHLTNQYEKHDVVRIPIAHAEGRFICDHDTLDQMQTNDQILFRYCSSSGQLGHEFNINGSLESIAGICNSSRNVFGMMPHPERASESQLGNTDGLKMFLSMIKKQNQTVGKTAELSV